MGAWIAGKMMAGAAIVASSFLPTGKAAAQPIEDALVPPTAIEQVLPSKTPAQEKLDAALGALGSDVYVSTALRARLADGVVSRWDVKVLDATVDTQRARHGKQHPQVVALRHLKGAVEELKDAQPDAVTKAENKKDEVAGKDEVRREEKQQELDATFRSFERRLEFQFYLRNQGFGR